MCKKSGESIDHLLLHCELGTKLWSAHFQLLRGYGEQVIGELEGTIGTPYCFENVEVGCFMFNGVYFERVECKEL
jgi:hypothetical protein